MEKRSQFWLWAALVSAILLGALWQYAPLADASKRIENFPLKGIGYQGRDVPLEPFEEEFFQDVTVVKRVYEVGGNYFFITILDGTQNRHVVHDPYYCFRGGGWDIVKETPFPIPGGTAAKLVIEKDGHQREALFWFSDGKERYSSPLKYWMQTSLRRLTLGLSGGEPILFVVQPLTNEPVDWNAFKQHFSKLFEI